MTVTGRICRVPCTPNEEALQGCSNKYNGQMQLVLEVPSVMSAGWGEGKKRQVPVCIEPSGSVLGNFIVYELLWVDSVWFKVQEEPCNTGKFLMNDKAGGKSIRGNECNYFIQSLR